MKYHVGRRRLTDIGDHRQTSLENSAHRMRKFRVLRARRALPLLIFAGGCGGAQQSRSRVIELNTCAGYQAFIAQHPNSAQRAESSVRTRAPRARGFINSSAYGSGRQTAELARCCCRGECSGSSASATSYDEPHARNIAVCIECRFIFASSKPLTGETGLGASTWSEWHGPVSLVEIRGSCA